MKDVEQKIERELSYLRSKFRAIYDPRTAFGNDKLIAILREIDTVLDRREQIEGSDACWRCEGTGHLLHECDCDLCTERWIDCETCDGRGYVKQPGHMRSRREIARNARRV